MQLHLTQYCTEKPKCSNVFEIIMTVILECLLRDWWTDQLFSLKTAAIFQFRALCSKLWQCYLLFYDVIAFTHAIVSIVKFRKSWDINEQLHSAQTVRPIEREVPAASMLLVLKVISFLTYSHTK